MAFNSWYDWDGSGSQQRAPSGPRPGPLGLAGDVNPLGEGNDLDVPEGFNANAVGLAGITPFGERSERAQQPETPMAMPPPGLAGYANFRYAGGGAVPSYAQGGAIDTEDNPMMQGMGAQLQIDINAALGVVKDVLSYGRQLHGLGGGGDEEGGAVDTAGIMPSVPHRETPTPQPFMPPGSLPYGPNEKPFGRRTSQGGGRENGMDMAGLNRGVMPSAPFSETPKPQPMPGPLPPTNNPFGKRVSENEEPTAGEETETPQQEMAEGAIDTDEEFA